VAKGAARYAGCGPNSVRTLVLKGRNLWRQSCVATIYVTRQLHTVLLYRSSPWEIASNDVEQVLCFPPVPLPCQSQFLAGRFPAALSVHGACNGLKPLPELQLNIDEDGGIEFEFGFFTTTGAVWEDMDRATIARVLALCSNEHVSSDAVRPA